MTESHWWVIRLVCWGTLVGCLLAVMPASVAIFALGAVIFTYFALEFWVEDTEALLAGPPDDEDDYLERDCA